MNWLFHTAISLFLYGLWAFFPKISQSYINPKSFLIFNTIGGLFVTVFIFFTTKGSLETSPKGVSFALLTGFCGVLGTLFFVLALKTGGKSSVIVTITALYPIIAIILALIVFKEAISIKQWIGMSLALVGVFLMSK
ncbi:EamA family transporter [bacterium]|nr:EamA family transporter [bacterium]